MDGHGTSAILIRGYGAFMAQYRKANWQRLIDRVQKQYSPGRLVGAARTAKEMLRLTMAQAATHVLVNCYNHGLKIDRLEKPETK